MAVVNEPMIGNWYKTMDGQSFKVVAFDEQDETIGIQYFDGALEEMDIDTWHGLEPAPVAPPEDWSGPFDDLERDDFGYSDSESSNRTWSNFLDELD